MERGQPRDSEKFKEEIRKIVAEFAAKVGEEITKFEEHVDKELKDFDNKLETEFERLKKGRVDLAEGLEKWRHKFEESLRKAYEELEARVFGAIEDLKESFYEFRGEIDKKWEGFEDKGEEFEGDFDKKGEDYKAEIVTEFDKLRMDLEQYLDDAFDSYKTKLKEGAKKNSKGEKGDVGPSGKEDIDRGTLDKGVIIALQGSPGELYIHKPSLLSYFNLNGKALKGEAVYNSEIRDDERFLHVMSLAAHRVYNLKEFKEYGIIDYVEGIRKKPENPEDYNKLSDEEKADRRA